MLTPEQVDHIAKLSRLDVSPEERELFAAQLTTILDWVGMLSEVPTDGVEPMQHVARVENVFGDDVAAPVDAATRERLLSQFPERQGDLLKVKAVFS